MLAPLKINLKGFGKPLRFDHRHWICSMGFCILEHSHPTGPVPDYIPKKKCYFPPAANVARYFRFVSQVNPYPTTIRTIGPAYVWSTKPIASLVLSEPMT